MMTGKLHRKTMKVKSVVASLIVLFMIFTNISCSVANAFRVVSSEDPAAQEELNKNQYIRNRYENWKTVTMPEGYTFRIPEQWELVFEGAELHLTEGNHIIARGWAYDPADADAKTKDDRMQDILGFYPVKTDSKEYWVHHTGQMGVYSKDTFENDAGEIFTYYRLHLA